MEDKQEWILYKEYKQGKVYIPKITEEEKQARIRFLESTIESITGYECKITDKSKNLVEPEDQKKKKALAGY